MSYWYIYETEHEIQKGAIARCMRGLEVVRCKECKFLMTENEKNGILYADDRAVICKGLGENGFCSRGEKNEKETEKYL